MDIDVITNILPVEKDLIEKLVSSFEKKEFDVLNSEIISALEEKSHFSVFDKNSPFRIDMKSSFTELDRNALKNKRKFRIFDLETWIEDPM